MSELSHYEKTGYLHDDFKIFHLKDTSMRPIGRICCGSRHSCRRSRPASRRSGR